MIALEPHLVAEIAGYLRRVSPSGHDEADRIFEIVTYLEKQAAHHAD